MTTEEACAVLGLEPGADAKAVQAAYRKRALEWHPDRASSAEGADYYARKFMEAREAYELLRRGGCPAPAPERVVEEPEYFRRTAGRSFAPKGKEDPLRRARWSTGQESSPSSWLLWGLVIPAGAAGVALFIRYLWGRSP